MLLINLIKRIPHPTYGNYGGFYKRCKNRDQNKCPLPIDWMDRDFMLHDHGIYTDQDLYVALTNGSPENLSLYGKLYRIGAIGIFFCFGFISKF